MLVYMRIGVHAKALSELQPTGVAVYARNLLSRMLALPAAQAHEWILYTDGGIVENTKYQISVPSDIEGQNIKYCLLRTPMLWTQVRLAWELLRRAPDVFFTPQHVLPLTAPKRSVVTIHGLEYERYPQYYSWREFSYLRGVTKDAVRRSVRVIAVSETTKRDLVDLYRVPEEKITIIYHGTPSQLSSSGLTRGSIDSRRSLPRVRSRGGNDNKNPYFLFLGRIELKKNVDGVIRAFEIVKERYKLSHKLILAGGDGRGSKNIKYQISNIKYRDHIKLLGYVSKTEKYELLRGAEAFVFPSWYEGFGLPILEAQSVGVPVITSNISAMPEVGGRAALYADPANPESIADAMRRVAEDQKVRDDLIATGYENTKRFSWETCARETLSVLAKL